jgi:hypothetical protein
VVVTLRESAGGGGVLNQPRKTGQHTHISLKTVFAYGPAEIPEISLGIALGHMEVGTLRVHQLVVQPLAPSNPGNRAAADRRRRLKPNVRPKAASVGVSAAEHGVRDLLIPAHVERIAAAAPLAWAGPRTALRLPSSSAVVEAAVVSAEQTAAGNTRKSSEKTRNQSATQKSLLKPFRTITPCSDRWARRALISCVRCPTSGWRVRNNIARTCWSGDLTGTVGMVGRIAASAIASASAMSFF